MEKLDLPVIRLAADTSQVILELGHNREQEQHTLVEVAYQVELVVRTLVEVERLVGFDLESMVDFVDPSLINVINNYK